MAHVNSNSSYNKLIDRLNRFPQGAPKSDNLYKILSILFSKEEAELVSQLPVKPFNVNSAANIWKTSVDGARKILDGLASRAILVDIETHDGYLYVLPPPMAGFFEFSMMRMRGDINQKLLSELFYQYINIEDDFIKSLFTKGETQLGRVFVDEESIVNENSFYVLDYERSSDVIKSATDIGISMCYCRHKKEHLGLACDAPMDICMTFNITASSLIRHGHARKVDASECLDLLDVARGNDLVQFGENVQQSVNFICNCCSCCCEAMISARKFGFMNPVHTSNFIVHIDGELCNGCGKCLKKCPVEAIKLENNNQGNGKKELKASVNEDFCLGCGVCFKNCKSGSISMIPREKRVITPLSSTHRVIMMAIERGNLQDMIFDNKVLWSHRMLAMFLGVILKLPPSKKILANKQVQSRYVEEISRRYGKYIENEKKANVL
jgi:Pyruvate/2-oxoacid:ferredoxin oxidoreductase delta subunit